MFPQILPIMSGCALLGHGGGDVSPSLYTTVIIYIFIIIYIVQIGCKICICIICIAKQAFAKIIMQKLHLLKLLCFNELQCFSFIFSLFDFVRVFAFGLFFCLISERFYPALHVLCVRVVSAWFSCVYAKQHCIFCK